MRAESRGFSLLEVLVALAVLALAMAALVRSAGQEAASLADARERMHAQWIAADLIAELRLEPRPPQPGTREGRLAFGGRDWQWQVSVAPTGVDGVRRIDARVAPLDASQATLVLTGFVQAR